MSAPLDSRQLKAFVLLARTGSVKETARQLFLTHSAVSHAMRALEQDAGCGLLRREGKRILLTEAGETLLAHAQRIVEELEEARQSLARLNEWGTRRLRVGAEAGLAHRFLPQVLGQLREKYPRLSVDLTIAEAATASTLLETNQVDVILGAEPARSGPFDFTPLFSDRFHIFLSPGHPLAAQRNLSREDLSQHPCILPRRSHPGRQLIDDYLVAENLRFMPGIEVDHFEAARNLVALGLGPSLLPGWVAAAEWNAGTLLAIPLGRRHLTQTWGLLNWRDRPGNHAHATFTHLCRTEGSRFVTTVS